MRARTIITSQPDVACDVCERRLLRGEQPDAFLADGRRVIVCELCAPRATQAGWLREGEVEGVALPAPRPRRGRSMFARLRQGARTAGGAQDMPLEEQPAAGFQEDAGERAAALAGTPGAGEVGTTLAGGGEATHGHPAPGFAGGGRPRSYVQEAVEVFNASAFPRRVAGLMRSLGPPLANVRSSEHLASVVRIVFAWELCWYRYEVDLSEGPAEVHALAQGSELSELAAEERHPNARIRDSGELEVEALDTFTPVFAEQV